MGFMRSILVNNLLNRLVMVPVCALFMFSADIMAHGINFEIAEHPPVVKVKVFFSRTAPLVDAAVNVYAPGDDKPYQRGRTDRAGFFAFVPDRAGDWTVRVDDERGHVDRVTVTVSGNFFDGEKAETGDAEITELPEPAVETIAEQGLPVFYRILAGLAVIFGLTGIVFGVRARQELRNMNKGS